MANYTRSECDFPSTVQFWLSIGTTGIFMLVGLSLQSFIVGANVIDWLNGQSLTTADQMITYIGISRFFLLSSSLLHFISLSCSAKIFKICFILALFTGTASGFCSIWLSSLLSIFFCFKISTFHNGFFLHLKTIISQKLIPLIIASVVLGFGYSFMFLLATSHSLLKSSSFFDFLNDTRKSSVIFSLNCLWNIFPLLTLFASSFFLIISLVFHIRQMKNHGNVMKNTGSYHKMIIFSAMTFLTCALGTTVNLLEWYAAELLGIVWMYIFYNMFPLLHSVALIYVTTKLRNQFLRTVLCGMDFFQEKCI